MNDPCIFYPGPRRLLLGFMVGMLGGTLVTTQAAAASCAAGELLYFVEPVVSVVAGPGDPVAEEALWSTFELIQMIGPEELHVGGTEATVGEAP